MAIISDENYKVVKFGKCFAIYPDWLMKVLGEYNLKTLDRLLYLCLYQHADTDTGICYPSYKVLRAYTGVKNNASIKQGLDRLVDAGLIEIVKKGHFSEGVNMANTYRVRFPYPDDWLVSGKE